MLIKLSATKLTMSWGFPVSQSKGEEPISLLNREVTRGEAGMRIMELEYYLARRARGVKRGGSSSIIALRYSIPMQTGNRFRTTPTPAQEQILLQSIGHQRSSTTPRSPKTGMTGPYIPMDQSRGFTACMIKKGIPQKGNAFFNKG